MQLNNNLELVTATKSEKHCFDSMDKIYKKYARVSDEEAIFLHTLIQRYKPRKILQVGCLFGATDAVMLNAAEINAHLHSIDIYNHDNKTGICMDHYPELKDRWTLHLNQFAYKFMDTIGDGIDFLFLDTGHCNPGEVLDLLMVLPYLKDDAIIAVHDVNIQQMYQPSMNEKSKHCFFTCNNLFSTLSGDKKFAPKKDFEDGFINIGAVKCSSDTKKNIFDIINLLSLPWAYTLPDSTIIDLFKFFEKHYSKDLVLYMRKIFDSFNGLKSIEAFFNTVLIKE